MILADKITEERKRNGWSQEELADKLGVSRQAVSKWESAGTVPDLQKVIQLADIFGVSIDYLLKDDIVLSETEVSLNTTAHSSRPIRRVSMEEANSFLDMKRKNAPIIANATFMCIISPVLLILLGTMADGNVLHIKEPLAAGAGLLFLFGMIASAVYMFIISGMCDDKMKHLEKEEFETEYGVSGMVKERKSSYLPLFYRGIAFGVVLCIVAAVPLIIGGLAEAPDYFLGALVALLLLLVAAGVNVIIRVSIIMGSYDTLLEEGEYTRSEKRVKGKLEVLNGIYWCLATAIYLGWSFWSMRWDFTWIVWPVAGVLFAVYSGIARLVIGAEKE